MEECSDVRATKEKRSVGRVLIVVHGCALLRQGRLVLSLSFCETNRLVSPMENVDKYF